MFAPQLASPMTLTEIGRYVVDDGWVMEQKLDGHRLALVLSPDAPPKAITRNGTYYTRTLPASVQNLRSDPGPVIDGELVGNTFWAFDILAEDESMHRMALHARRAVLERFVTDFEALRVVPQARTTEEKEHLLLHAAAERLEGVVVKRIDSPYVGRRSRAWLKAKFVSTADVVILAVRDDGKDSASLGIRMSTPAGDKWVEVGRCSLNGKPPVAVGDVVEVRYLYVQHPEAPRLYQPDLTRVRKDKSPLDCDGSDFRVTSKIVLRSLP